MCCPNNGLHLEVLKVVSVRIKVRYSDTDAMGITHHSNYFRFFEVARTEWLKEKGHDYRTWEKKGLNLPLIAASADFKRPTRFDDEVEIKVRVIREGIRIHFNYDVHMLDAGPHGTVTPGTVVASGRTMHVVTDLTMKPIRLPKELENIFDE